MKHPKSDEIRPSYPTGSDGKIEDQKSGGNFTTVTEKEVARSRTQEEEHLALADGPALLFGQSAEYACEWTPQSHLQQASRQKKQGDLRSGPPRDSHSAKECPEQEGAPIEHLDSAALDGKVDPGNANCMGVVHILE